MDSFTLYRNSKDTKFVFLNEVMIFLGDADASPFSCVAQHGRYLGFKSQLAKAVVAISLRQGCQPGSNLRWESSRMMLPEHREAILNHNRNKNNKIPKELDEQEWQLVETAIHQSINSRQTLTISLYDPHEDLEE